MIYTFTCLHTGRLQNIVLSDADLSLSPRTEVNASRYEVSLTRFAVSAMNWEFLCISRRVGNDDAACGRHRGGNRRGTRRRRTSYWGGVRGSERGEDEAERFEGSGSGR